MTPVIENDPIVGQAVLVSYYDTQHNVKSAVAHVLAISPFKPDGSFPTLTVAYPADPIDAIKLGSPHWADAYVRAGGVPHFSAPEAIDGKVPVVWGHAADQSSFPNLQKPDGDGQNPIYTREIIGAAREQAPDVAQILAVQTGQAPQPSAWTPVVSEAAKSIDPTTTDPAEPIEGEPEGEPTS